MELRQKAQNQNYECNIQLIENSCLINQGTRNDFSDVPDIPKKT